MTNNRAVDKIIIELLLNLCTMLRLLMRTRLDAVRQPGAIKRLFGSASDTTDGAEVDANVKAMLPIIL